MFPTKSSHVFAFFGPLFLVLALALQLALDKGVSASPVESSSYSSRELTLRIRRYAKPPSVQAAPLDPNDAIHHTLDEVSSILGTVGGAASGAVMGLTGISITDCALSIKDEDLTTITCAQFINKISQCDSMTHLKPLLQQAKHKYKQNPHSKAPCFAKKGRKGK